MKGKHGKCVTGGVGPKSWRSKERGWSNVHIYISLGDMNGSCGLDGRSAIGLDLIIPQGHSVSTACVSLP
jgi:hypothetical protein